MLLIAARGLLAHALPILIAQLSSIGMMVVDTAVLGHVSAADLAATARGLAFAANQHPDLSGVYTTFSAESPQLYLTIDRERLYTLGVPLNEVFAALQATMGSAYVNDFNLFGRTWQVVAQADSGFRDHPDDITRLKTRNAAGQMEFKLRTPWRDGTTHLVMSPLEFMQRLAALAR